MPDRFDPDSRAQIVLVGAVAMAFIIIGLVIVFNTVLFTENVGSTGSLQSTHASGTYNHQVRQGTKGLVYRINDDGLSSGDLNDSVERNVTKYSHLLAESRASSSPVIVNASFNRSASAYGSMVIDDDPVAKFENGTLVNDTDIGGFVLTVNVSTLNSTYSDHSNSFRVRVTDNNSDETTVAFVNHSGNLEIWNDRPGESWQKRCTITRGTDFHGDFVQVRLSAGLVPANQSCRFGFTHEMNPGYDLSLINSTSRNASGSYHFAVNASPTDSTWQTSNTPSPKWALWRVGLDVTYDSPNARYVNQQSVFVYNTTR